MTLVQDEQMKNFHSKLQKVTRFDEVIEISRSIFFMNIEKKSITLDFQNRAGEIVQLFQIHFSATKLISHHKVIIKAIVKLSNYCQVDCFGDILEKYAVDYGVIGTNCLSAYGRLQNYKMFEGYIYNPDILHDSFVQGSLKYSKNTQFFSLAIENYIQAYEIKLVQKNDPNIVIVICTNLENNHKNIHKLLLELFKKVLMLEKGNDESTVSLILEDMSWYNRNKHYLLIQLITARIDMLLKYKNFDIVKFINGLRCGLSQYHLYSSSLSLVKVIYNKSPFREELLKISIDIILKGSDYEMKNFFKLWFTAYDDQLKDDLFNAIIKSQDFSKISSTSSFFLRSLIIRNAFNRQLSIQIENSVKNFCYSIEDVDLKLEMFSILLSNIYESKNIQVILENVMRFLKFLNFNMCVEDSLFIDTIMKKLPNFFNHLATSRFRNKLICKELFTIIRDDLFFHGLEFGTYESKIFSVRLLEVILKQYCGTKGRRLSKMTNNKNNQEFMEYLKVNGIWDLTSIDNFNLLVDMSRDTENSDISGIANEIITEYFIKSSAIDENAKIKGTAFLQWINFKMTENLNICDVESYHENISYCKMKLEYLLTKSSSLFLNEIKRLIEDLETRHKELSISKDPVYAMESGKSLFPLIDTIIYALSRVDNNLLTRDLILNLTTLTKDITIQFLDFISDGKSSPSFDLLDKNLSKLIKTSKWNCNTDFADLKHKLLLSFFFTTRALSELSVALAKIINTNLKPHEDEYFTGLSSCIAVNVQILTRFCHKGVIESASQSLGSITKIVSTEFLQQCDRKTPGSRHLQKLLIILKLEIDCGRRHSSKTGEIRGGRGLVLMAHLITRNHPPFLKFLMEKMLDLVEIKSFYDTQKIKFVHNIQPINLHLLAIIVKDSELVEEMLPYYDYILLSTFSKYKETKDFVMQNALLQIIGNITPKISNHKRHFIDESDSPKYESKAISVYEHYVKFTYSYRIALFDFENNLKDLSQTYIIILLEMLSNFEYRMPFEYWTEMERMSDALKRLINHQCEKIRILAAKCFAQWQLPDQIPKIIQDKIRYIFSSDQNLAHGSIVACRNLILRYESSIKFVKDFNRIDFLRNLRQKVVKTFEKDYSEVPKNFYLRYHLFEFLMFLGFNIDHNIIQKLMNEDAVDSNIGYQLWRKKISEYNKKTIQ